MEKSEVVFTENLHYKINLILIPQTRPPKQSFSAEAVNISPFRVLFSGPTTFLSRYLCGRKDFNLLHGRHVHASGEMVVAWSEPFR